MTSEMTDDGRKKTGRGGTTNVPREWGSLLGLRCEQVDQHFEVAR